MKVTAANDRDYCEGPITHYNAHLFAATEADIERGEDALEAYGIQNIGLAPEETGFEGESDHLMVTVYALAGVDYDTKAEFMKDVRKAIKTAKKGA